MKKISVKKLALAGMLCALCVVGSVFSFPMFGSKCAPIQHMVNVTCAVLLGPWWGVGVAFVASLLRNLLGLGSLMAFPGSMFGALLCGLVYHKTKNILATMVARMFLVLWYTRPHSSAPNMLPGKAIRLPRPSRLRSSEATKATPTPHHGPSSTAQVTLTMCWMGAHLLPNMGKLNTLPTTHRAHSMPANASFFTEIFFIRQGSFPNLRKQQKPYSASANSPHPVPDPAQEL